MLFIAEDKTTYPDGQIPNLEDDGKAYAEIVGRIQPLLPKDFEEEALGQLVTWSATKFGDDKRFDTWVDAVTAATDYARTGFTSGPDQRQRDLALDTADRDKLGVALLSTGRTDDKQLRLRDKSRRWANCGLAAFQIREQLSAKGGDLVGQPAETLRAGDGDKLRKALLAKPASAETVLLLDCQFPQVHNFIIEVHHDGSRYLAQGYQGAYFAHWWLGLDESYAGTANADILALRDRYGRGRPISPEDYASLVDGLVTAISSTWPEVAGQWRRLPFNPDRQEVDGIKGRSGSPTFLVEVFEVRKPAVARTALGGGNGSLSELATRGLSAD
ncbi:hypothetical protein O7614_16220 [Micromonospora sp. WMMD961]|uniref:hypothetical protein n=1 Tax=Micromonospora sp. WMMD961 TaxID=3016100 RepID=UPI0024168382|nr:hypothetical protein [Micromonospora sp. WMMD961]MDG4781195.1 hypothetical protein [Micromonospora sp. WMMD961]